MAYLTYTDYQKYGGRLDEATFANYEFRARKLIDNLTHGRVRDDNPQREAVCRAMTVIIDMEARDATYDGREVASMGNDGVSISYATEGHGEARRRYVAVILDFLSDETADQGVPLLYAGVDA